MSDVGERLLGGRDFLPPAKGNGHRQSASDASADLLGLLEDRITDLVARFQQARRTIESLESRLEAAEARAAKGVEEQEHLRTDLRARVSRLIDQIRKLEQEAPVGDGS